MCSCSSSIPACTFLAFSPITFEQKMGLVIVQIFSVSQYVVPYAVVRAIPSRVCGSAEDR